MSREKQGYRETIELMTNAGIRYLVTQTELARFCGVDRRTVARRWPELTGKFPVAKTEAARVICK